MPSVTLKTGAGRSVRVEGHPGPAATVVKHIDARGLARTWRLRRARAEFAVQQALFAAGVSVPEPLELRTGANGLELVSRYLADARSLHELERGPPRAPAWCARAARHIGELVARAHAVGLDHPDLHEKNVLVTGEAQPYLIDFAGARIRGRFDPRTARRDLVQLAAATRERVPLRLRQRALAAWWRATAAEQRPRGRLGNFAAALEDAARARRVTVLERSARRWVRVSSATRAFSIGGASGLARAEFGDAQIVAFALDTTPAARAYTDLAGTALGTLAELLGDAAPGALVVSMSGGNSALATWKTAARLEEHALRAPRPLVIVRRPVPRAVFALPSRTTFAAAWEVADGRGRIALAGALGALFGALDDRALALDARAARDVWIDACGRAWLGPTLTLQRHVRSPAAEPWSQGLALVGDATATEQRAFLDAWRREHRGVRAEACRA